MCVGSLDHLDNCKSFRVFNIFKSMSKNSYIYLLTKGSDLLNKGNNKITELRTFLQRESQNS
jgi:ABC-type lipoprotein release transport system permease subunit